MVNMSEDMQPFWRLARVAASFIMLQESSENTEFNMVQVASITQQVSAYAQQYSIQTHSPRLRSVQTLNNTRSKHTRPDWCQCRCSTILDRNTLAQTEVSVDAQQYSIQTHSSDWGQCRCSTILDQNTLAQTEVSADAQQYSIKTHSPRLRCVQTLNNTQSKHTRPDWGQCRRSTILESNTLDQTEVSADAPPILDQNTLAQTEVCADTQHTQSKHTRPDWGQCRTLNNTRSKHTRPDWRSVWDAQQYSIQTTLVQTEVNVELNNTRSKHHSSRLRSV